MAARWFKSLLAWVIVTAVVLIVATIVVVDLADTLVVDETAARDRHAAFLRAAGAMSRSIQESEQSRHLETIERTGREILQLRPGLRRLSYFEITENRSPLIWSSDTDHAPDVLPVSEVSELKAGRSASYFDTSTDDRAWIIAAPITIKGQMIGALRGRFSVAKFDRITAEEREHVRLIAVVMVALTCLTFFILVQRQIHRPIHRLLEAMRRAEGGDLTSRTALEGPSDLQEVSRQFHRMLDRVRAAMNEKEQLLEEIQRFNTTLETRVTEATNALEQSHTMLGEARIQAERNEKLAALGELSAVIAHELGNPLNAISGHLQLLEKASDREQLRRHLTILKSETDRMVCTIQNVLDSTRIQAETIPLDMNAIIREVLAVVTPTAEAQKITLKTNLSPRLPLVMGDARALHGLVFNLITNAVHAMPRGGELDLTSTDMVYGELNGVVVIHGSPKLNCGAVRVLVRDTGAGIPEKTLLRIFEPFYTTRHHAGGTGLGLTICQRTVSAHGGRIIVQSAVGQGTQFIIDLPAAIQGAPEGDTSGHFEGFGPHRR
ncbi:MAG: ATP-binding protein [Nitrospira sp.]